MQIKLTIPKIAFLILLSLITAGCTSAKHKKMVDFIAPKIEAITPEPSKEEAEAYNKAMQLFEKKKYAKAADAFAQVYYVSPGGQLTSYAELMEAYSYYLRSDYVDCINALDNFIKFYPAHPDIEWAHYLKLRANLEQTSGVYHDQSNSKGLEEEILTFIKRFPNSKYLDDAVGNLAEIVTIKHNKDRSAAYHYLKSRNNPIAAVGRFRNIASQPNSYQEEALYRLFEIYSSLNLQDEAKFYANELLKNFPNGSWGRKIDKSR